MPTVAEHMAVEIFASHDVKLKQGHLKTYVPKALGGGPAVSGALWSVPPPETFDEWEAPGQSWLGLQVIQAVHAQN